MGVAIAGAPVSGKDTTADLLSEKTKLPLIKGSLRLFAKDVGIDILDFEKEYANDQDKWDKKLDEWQRTQVAKHKETGYILVSMLAARNAPSADLKIWLYAGLEERARRVSKRDNIPSSMAVNYISERENTFLKRMKELYGMNPWSLDMYDMVINTEFWKPEKCVSIILNAMKERRELK